MVWSEEIMTAFLIVEPMPISRNRAEEVTKIVIFGFAIGLILGLLIMS